MNERARRREEERAIDFDIPKNDKPQYIQKEEDRKETDRIEKEKTREGRI